MDKTDMELRIDRLENALSIAIEALEQYVGGDESPTIEYLVEVLEDTALDDFDF